MGSFESTPDASVCSAHEGWEKLLLTDEIVQKDRACCFLAVSFCLKRPGFFFFPARGEGKDFSQGGDCSGWEGARGEKRSQLDSDSFKENIVPLRGEKSTEKYFSGKK